MALGGVLESCSKIFDFLNAFTYRGNANQTEAREANLRLDIRIQIEPTEPPNLKYLRC